MGKIKVVHFVEQTGYGGTEKMMYILCKFLNKEIFDVYAAFPDNHPSFGNHRKFMFYNILPKENIIEFAFDNKKEFEQKFAKLNCHILHCHRDGLPRWPLSYNSISVPVRVETNVFSNFDPWEAIDRTYFMAKTMQEVTAPRNGFPDPYGRRFQIMYAPVEAPASNENLRQELDISKDRIVFGRMGSAWSWSKMILHAYKKIESKQNLLLVLMPPEQWKREAQGLGIKNIIYLENPLIKDEDISKFFNSIDVQVHAKDEGECCPGSIIEGMRHGLPVITHKSPNNNGQVEVVGNTGFVTNFGDIDAYSKCMLNLQENIALRKAMGLKAQKRAIELFDVQKITNQLEKDYLSLVKEKNLAI